MGHGPATPAGTRASMWPGFVDSTQAALGEGALKGLLHFYGERELVVNEIVAEGRALAGI